MLTRTCLYILNKGSERCGLIESVKMREECAKAKKKCIRVRYVDDENNVYLKDKADSDVYTNIDEKQKSILYHLYIIILRSRMAELAFKQYYIF